MLRRQSAIGVGARRSRWRPGQARATRRHLVTTACSRSGPRTRSEWRWTKIVLFSTSGVRPHWRRVAGPVVLAPIVVGLASYGWFSLPDDSARKVLRWVILAAALVILVWWSVRPFLFWLTTRYVVTDRRVLMRHGVLDSDSRPTYACR